MTDLPATFFDGRSARSRAVRLRWHAFDRVLEVIPEPGDEPPLRRVPPKEFTIESRLGRAPRFVRFKDGGRCEVADNPELDALIASWGIKRPGSWLHRVETSWTHVLVAFVLLLAMAGATVIYGLPWAARRVAFAIPAELVRKLGSEALDTLDRTMFEPTKLEHARQIELRGKFRDFLARTGDTTPYQIEFRGGRGVGANAFALPSGTIVITDELVKLAEDDREILAVLAHECGHVQHRHALRGVVQNSAVFVLVALVTGDVSSATAFGGALPTFLLQTKFSREFESEADSYAMDTLRRGDIDPAMLATMLERLRKQHGEIDSKMLDYLRSHPSTPERVERIRGKR